MNDAVSQDGAAVPTAAAERLVRSAGLGGMAAMVPLAGGANNRVFRLDTCGGPVVLKSYFHHPGDPRDRLAAEWAFIRLAWDDGIRCVPQPLAADPAAHLGLYGWVEGTRLTPGQVDEVAVAGALDFVTALNRLKDGGLKERAAALSAGSEACFHLAGHLETVERRLARLETIDPDGGQGDGTYATARDLVSGRVRPVWRRLAAAVERGCARLGLDRNEPLPAAGRCLSPSDFGFHNALRRPDGAFAFLDFEYAGWDDPAKLVGDFFNQVAVPVPETHYAAFRSAVAGWSGNPERESRRIDLLQPVYAAKWIAILLNDFLPVGDRRRGFAADAATGPDAARTRRQGQLIKVEAALARLEAVADTLD